METRTEQESNELIEKLNFIAIVKGVDYNGYVQACEEYDTTIIRTTIDLEYNAALQEITLMAEQANLINKQ
jgi:hypothetical protein